MGQLTTAVSDNNTPLIKKLLTEATIDPNETETKTFPAGFQNAHPIIKTVKLTAFDLAASTKATEALLVLLDDPRVIPTREVSHLVDASILRAHQVKQKTLRHLQRLVYDYFAPKLNALTELEQTANWPGFSERKKENLLDHYHHFKLRFWDHFTHNRFLTFQGDTLFPVSADVIDTAPPGTYTQSYKNALTLKRLDYDAYNQLQRHHFYDPKNKDLIKDITAMRERFQSILNFAEPHLTALLAKREKIAQEKANRTINSWFSFSSKAPSVTPTPVTTPVQNTDSAAAANGDENPPPYEDPLEHGAGTSSEGSKEKAAFYKR